MLKGEKSIQALKSIEKMPELPIYKYQELSSPKSI